MWDLFLARWLLITLLAPNQIKIINSLPGGQSRIFLVGQALTYLNLPQY